MWEEVRARQWGPMGVHPLHIMYLARIVKYVPPLSIFCEGYSKIEEILLIIYILAHLIRTVALFLKLIPHIKQSRATKVSITKRKGTLYFCEGLKCLIS